jgi:hypothetical protein
MSLKGLATLPQLEEEQARAILAIAIDPMFDATGLGFRTRDVSERRLTQAITVLRLT